MKQDNMHFQKLEKKEEKKLAGKLARWIGGILAAIFAVIAAAILGISGNALSTSIEGQFLAISKSTGKQIQSLVERAQSTASDMNTYIEKSYRVAESGMRNMAGQIPSEDDDMVFMSSIYQKPLSELNYDVERYLTELARATAIGNEAIQGVGVMFEPKEFGEAIPDYAFYVSEDIGQNDRIEPYGEYASYSKEDFYTAARESGGPVFTRPYEREGSLIMSYSCPILAEGAFKGVVVVDIDVSCFGDSFEPDARYSSMYCTVYTQDGNIIFDTEDTVNVNHNVSEFTPNEKQLKAIQSGMAGTEAFYITTTREDGRKVSRYYYPIQAGGETWWALTALDYTERNASVTRLMLLLVILSAGAVAAIILLVIKLLSSMLKPIEEVVTAAADISEGRLDISLASDSNDEIGKLSRVFSKTAENLRVMIADVNYLLGEMAVGNFAVKTRAEDSYTGDFENILLSIRKLNRKLSDTLRQINDVSGQVALGASQMAESSQGLAEGASDQAGSVEELQAAITSLADQAGMNAEESRKSYEKTEIVEEEASGSSAEMEKLTGAMAEISGASRQIGEIISDIEDIASQTNLLSLNAAIEAARAGEAGKGFAVVADQIRKLAEDSAESAVHTRELIETAVNKVEEGDAITTNTEEALIQVIQGIREIGTGAGRMRNASNLQAESIRRVEAGINQIAEVVQNNSAAAQETSATSEELSAQASLLRELVEQFKLK